MQLQTGPCRIPFLQCHNCIANRPDPGPEWRISFAIRIIRQDAETKAGQADRALHDSASDCRRARNFGNIHSPDMTPERQRSALPELVMGRGEFRCRYSRSTRSNRPETFPLLQPVSDECAASREYGRALVQQRSEQSCRQSHGTGRSRLAAFRDRDGPLFRGGATNAVFADGMMIDGRLPENVVNMLSYARENGILGRHRGAGRDTARHDPRRFPDADEPIRGSGRD